MTSPAPQSSDKTPRLNLRVVGLLILFTMIISASVIATDMLSVRNRSPVAATTFPASAP